MNIIIKCFNSGFEQYEPSSVEIKYEEGTSEDIMKIYFLKKAVSEIIEEIIKITKEDKK